MVDDPTDFKVFRWDERDWMVLRMIMLCHQKTIEEKYREGAECERPAPHEQPPANIASGRELALDPVVSKQILIALHNALRDSDDQYIVTDTEDEVEDENEAELEDGFKDVEEIEQDTRQHDDEISQLFTDVRRAEDARLPCMPRSSGRLRRENSRYNSKEFVDV